ncbi:ArsR family transcriptional regulator [Candidatus Woesearchaeota archaeon]|nr:MAG: ArsR family transcriptional regulator [Candidatus Woesearchaeota archaeon]
MAEESFMLVSLEESKAKQLAQVISNDTSRKILDFLAKKEASETEISKALNVPLSTIHYNLQQLQTANLVKVEEFHYSKKGKEINHYKLSNKLIIIAPKETFGLREALKKILPITILTLGAAAIIHVVQQAKPVMFAAKADFAAENTLAMVQAAPEAGLPFSLWFLFGALFVIALYLLFALIKPKQ